MQNRIAIFFILALMLLFAVVVGSNVALGDYESLSFYAIAGILIYFLIHGWKNVWWFTALLVFCGVVFYQGFMFEAYHLFVLMLLAATVLSFVHRQDMPQPVEFIRAGSRRTMVPVALLILYGAAHFAFNFVSPYNPLDYSWKTSTKAYFECYASMVCFFWLLAGSYGFVLKKNWGVFFIFILVFALFGNVLVRGYMFAMGFQAADGLEGDIGFSSLNVPVINMNPGVYTLREICPLATAILLMVATAPGWWRPQKRWVKLMILSGILLCLFGSLFGGGRMTLVFCLVLAFIVSIARRSVGTVLAMGMGAVLLIAAVNIFSTQINRDAPGYVSRSLQFMMLEKGEVYSTISDSQYVRNLAIRAGIDEWRTDTRTLLVGRSVFHLDPVDAEYTKQTLGWDGFVINALKAGRTHNMITDLLVQYGIIGLVLYVTAYLSVIRFYWKLDRFLPAEAVWSKALAGSMKLYLPLSMIYNMAGGNYMPTVAALVIGLIRADLVTFHRTPALAADPNRGQGSPDVPARRGRFGGTGPVMGANR